MKLFLNILFLGLCVFELNAQFRAIPMRLHDTKQTAADTTLSLPFWEDFATSGNTPDTLKWSYGFDVFVNDGLPLNPPTYKVATLDGITGFGTAYDVTSEVVGETDSLVSQKINLAGLSATDNVYISFYWQAGGNGELPDEDDSLSLQFLTIDGQWRSVWNTVGGQATAPFKQELLHISDPNFLHAGFKFRFQSYGNIAGPFDTWHLDYIYINKARNDSDTLHLDRAITGQSGPLFGPYGYVPSKVLFEDPSRFNIYQSMVLKNLYNEPQAITLYYKLENLTTAETYIDSPHPTPSLSSLQTLTVDTETIFDESDSIITAQVAPLDSQVLRSTFYMNSGDKFIFEETNVSGDSLFSDVSLRSNDTVRFDYTLQNFYAYDDGTAEYSYGIKGNQGKLAIRYVLARPDTLSHVDICFPSINPTAVGEEINVMVWSRIGENERVIATQSHTITENTSINQFQRIALYNAKLIQDTFYIGFQQFREEYIGVGFDKSNPDAMSEIFSKTSSAVWQQNDRLEGIFMIRPVFAADSTYVLANEEITPEPELLLFPNPSSGTFSINLDHERIEVYNLSGIMIYQSDRQNNYQLEADAGMYFVRVFSTDGVQTKRLLIH